MRTLSLCLCVILAAPLAAQPELKTVMTERGKLLVSADFDKAPPKEFAQNKGKWQVVDGALRAAELPADMHGAVMRHPLAVHNAVIQYDFKMDGSKRSTLSINGAGGHVCRVLLSPTGFTVKKDKDKKKPDDKGANLASCTIDIKPGVWHTLLVELHGKEMVACLDGKHYAIGKHDGIDVKKTNFGLTVAGEAMFFKNLRVWEAQPKADWTATRAKLLAK